MGLTALCLGYRPHDREPQPSAVFGAGGVGPRKALPSLRKELGWEAGPVVGHVQLDDRAVSPCAELDETGRVTQRVGKEVVQVMIVGQSLVDRNSALGDLGGVPLIGGPLALVLASLPATG